MCSVVVLHFLGVLMCMNKYSFKYQPLYTFKIHGLESGYVYMNIKLRMSVKVLGQKHTQPESTQYSFFRSTTWSLLGTIYRLPHAFCRLVL